MVHAARPDRHGLARIERVATCLVVCLVVGLSGTAAQQAPRPEARPNVLFLAVDDLNDWVGFLDGNSDARTPNMDRLAARGTVFTRAYCSAPACNPSRASLLCGVRPSTSGVYKNDQPWRLALEDAVTLPQHFMAAGYDVAGCGKIFHGSFTDPQSWHRFLARPQDPVPDKLPANGLRNTSLFDWGPVDVADAAMGDAQVVDWAIEQLASKGEQPLFLAVGLYRPHTPWYAPREYFEQHPLEDVHLPEVPRNDLNDVPRIGREMADPAGYHRRITQSGKWKQAVQGYLASIAFADAQVGRLLDSLEQLGLADDTIIVLWGDHGWHLGEKQHWRKFTLWEEATRVPLIIVAPGLTEPGSRSARTVSLLDLYPTLLDLCGLPQRDELEGTSLRSLLLDAAATWNRPVVTTHGRGNHSVRSERWRYIRYRDGSEELYDHDADPAEHHNLADDPQNASIKADLARWIPASDAASAKTSRQVKQASGKAARDEGSR